MVFVHGPFPHPTILWLYLGFDIHILDIVQGLWGVPADKRAPEGEGLLPLTTAYYVLPRANCNNCIRYCQANGGTPLSNFQSPYLFLHSV